MGLIDADKAKAELLAIDETIPAWPGFFDGLKTGYQSAADRLDTMSVVEERKHGHWEDIDLDTSVCSVCKNPQEYETRRIIMLYRFIFKILKELAETQQDLEITRSSNMTILTLLLEKKICSKEEYVSTFNEIQSKNMENINQIKNKIHEIEEQIKQYEQQMRKKG